MEESKLYKIAIIGGTGKEGQGLAYRWVLAGHDVMIGSRSIEKAQDTVDVLSKLLAGKPGLSAMTNDAAVAACEIAVLTVPFAAHHAILEQLKPLLAGKILIDVTVPLVPPQVTKVQMPPEGSATMQAQSILGDAVQVVAAFQNISHERLLTQGEIDCDVLVCGKGKQARQVVLGLVHDAGLQGWDAGPIENSVVVEGMTSILIGLNKQFGVHAAGIQLTGIPKQD